MSISTAVGFVLSNLPAFLFVLALAIAALGRGRGSAAHRFLDWILPLVKNVSSGWIKVALKPVAQAVEQVNARSADGGARPD